MNSQDKLSAAALEPYPGTNTQSPATEQPTIDASESLPAQVSEPAATKRSTLLESFYHWLMSRS